MENIQITRITVEGFRSYVDESRFSFDNSGLTLISGENGTGKTTLFSALLWVLYGSNLHETDNKAVQTYEWMRPKAWKGTRVQLWFSIGSQHYMVSRHISYSGDTLGLKGESKLMVFTNKTGEFTQSDMVGDALYKKDQQQYINELLGLSVKAFTNSLIFGQGLARLVKAPGTEKRALFEEFFDLGWVEEAKTKADGEKLTLTNTLQTLQSGISKVTLQCEHIQQQIDRETELQQQFEQQKAERIRAVKLEGQAATARLKELEQQLVYTNTELTAETEKARKASGKKKAAITQQEVSALLKETEAAQELSDEKNRATKHADEQVRQIDMAITRLEAEGVDLAAQARNIKTNCPTCNAPLKASDVEAAKTRIKEQIASKENEKRELQLQREQHVKYGEKAKKEHTEAKAAYDNVYEKYLAAKKEYADQSVNDDYRVTELKQQIGSIETKIETTKEVIAGIKARLKKEQAAEPPEDKVPGLQQQLATLEESLATHTDRVKEVEAELAQVNWWITEGFSSKGLKSYIFSAMLDKLNMFAASYAPYFGYNVRFWIDLDKKSKPFVTTIMRGGKEVDYQELSGGQKQRVDVILCFAMNDLASYKAPCNLLILDEVFESLDQAGVELAYEIIRKKAETKAVYVVSHSPFVEVNDANRVELSGGNNYQPSKIG